MMSTDAKRLVRVPMYQQINDILRALLKTGEFAQGDRFLTERQIAERFQVSRSWRNGFGGTSSIQKRGRHVCLLAVA